MQRWGHRIAPELSQLEREQLRKEMEPMIQAKAQEMMKPIEQAKAREMKEAEEKANVRGRPFNLYGLALIDTGVPDWERRVCSGHRRG